MFNAGVRGKRAKDSTGLITVGEHFNQQNYLVPTVTRFAVTDGSYVDTNDTAADTAGNQTIVVYGSGFAPGATILVGSTTISVVTFLDSGRLAFSSPALSSGSYTIFVTNANGGTGILVPGLVYSGVPTFTTAAGSLGSVYETTAINTTVVATGDAPITYALSSGSLPSGSTLSSGGTISGTAPVDGSSTTYSFTIQATDADNQDSVRSFSLTINTDVVSFSSPANNTTTTATQNSPISNVTVVATSAAGYGVLYTSSGLPTGLSMNTSTGIISGTPTVVASNTAIITATANTTTRTAALYLNWTINLPGDLFWKYASLLMTANPVPNGNTFNTDLSTFNNEVVVVGDTKPNEFHPFKEGYYSNYFDGTGDYLTVPSSTAFGLSTGDFTIEAWIYPTAWTNNEGTIIDFRVSGGASSQVKPRIYLTGGTLAYYVSGASRISTTLSSLNVWYHVSVVRLSGSTKLYVNGLQAGSTYTDANDYGSTAQDCVIGQVGDSRAFATGYFTGYISNLRVVKGTAVYTAAFTPPTAPLTYTANTVLLNCQSNKLIDNSNNNFTITKNGDTTVNPFSPFNGTPTTVTVPDANNYSMYFDGTGDYIDVKSNSVFAFGNSDFTIECWVYPTVAPSTSWNPILTIGTSTAGQEIRIGQNINNTGYGYLIPNNAGNSSVTSGFGTLTLNQWHHLALVRNGSTVTMYRNGTSVGSTGSVSFSFTNTTLIRIAGSQPAYTDGNFGGYISNLRVVKGTAVYTGNFTVPSSPLSITQSSSANTASLTTIPTNGASVYFDGTGDYLSIPGNAAFQFTSDFTVEFWVNLQKVTGYQVLVGQYPSGSVWGWVLQMNNGSTMRAIFNNSSTTGVINASTAMTTGSWYHVALTRSGSTCTLWFNGTSVGTSTLSGNIGTITDAVWIGNGGSADYTLGHISNLRVVKGTALYTSAFTPTTSPLTAVSGTSLLTCQSTSLIDNSTNAFTITRNGNASVANTFSPFANTTSLLMAQANTVIEISDNALALTVAGDARPTRNGPFANTTTVTLIGNEGSAYFDGTGDYLSMSAIGNPLDWPASANYTIEAWVYLNAFTGTESSCILARRNPTTTTTDWQFQISTTGALVLYNLNGATTITASSNLAIRQWNHCAAVISAGTARLYLNGRLVSTPTAISAASTASISTYIVGASNSVYLNGYISNLRVTKGTAVYTTPFVPSWEPSTPVANTVLLTGQTNLSSNTKVIVDESNLNNIITGNGNVNLGSFSPFGSTWSGYFDGNGDYIVMPNSSGINFGTGDFTVECWVNWSSTTVNRGIISRYAGASSGWALRYDNTGGPTLNWINGDTSILIASHTPIAGTWYHYAVCRSGTTLRMFINGTQSASTTYSGNQDNSSSLYIGSLTNTIWFLNGYISNVRILKGTALYTAAFTPSTTQLLPIANTTLLTCNTNKFVDYSAANNFITKSGDAAVSRFSPFSPVPVTPASYSGYFDGTGDGLVINGNAGPIGTEDFTWECYAYISTMGGSFPRIFESNTGASGSFQVYLSSGTLTVGGNGTGTITSYSIASLTNQWLHLCITRTGSAMRLFVNGVLRGYSASGGNNFPSGGAAWRTLNEGGGIIGYLSNMRVVRGSIVSAYSTSSTTTGTTIFTPPTSPLTAIANTQLLTCQSTTFIDNSNNAFTITVTGDAKPVIQNPFTDTVGIGTSYTANTYGNSIYLDGTTDYLNLSSPALLGFGTGNFTWECWIYPVTLPGTDVYIWDNNGSGDATATGRLLIMINSGGSFVVYTGTASTLLLTGGGTYIRAGQWTHLAITRSGTTGYMFINGALVNSATVSTNFLTSTASATNRPVIGGNGFNLSNLFTGHISNLRVLNGQALYTSSFVPSTQPAPVTSNTVLLAASTAGPSVTDALRISNMETFGTSRYVANNSPYYDTYSAYFDGNGDYLTLPSGNASLQPISSDFTIEAWVYPVAFVANGNPVAAIDVNATYYAAIRFGYESAGAISLLMSTNGTTWSINTSSGLGTLTLNTWQHMAVSKSGTSVRVFLNGVQQGSTLTLSSATLMTGTNNWIGYLNAPSAQYVNGYISNWRLTKTALYTTTFTPSTTPLTAIANTSLLTCQSNRFIDNSTNAFTITKAGDAKISAVQPFAANNTSRFSSVYFGTKTDYLAVRSQPSLTTFPGDFTFECWVYPTDTTLSTRWGIWDSRQAGATANPMIFFLTALASPVTGSWRMSYYNGTQYYGTGTILSNQWTHVAWVRSGTTMTFYVNGVAGGTATISGTQTGNATTAPIYIGSKDNGLAGYGTVGYIADLRITNGYARTITVPTAPYDIK